MAPATKETPIEKSLVTFNSLKDQAAVGLYFESTAFHGRLHDDRAEVLVQNQAFFAVDRLLYTKRNTGRLVIQHSAQLTTMSHQSNFRGTAKSYTGPAFTAEEAFLTVMAAWEFATMRPAVAHMDVAGSRSRERLTVGVHALVNEPFALPISAKELAEVRSGNSGVARRMARSAESIWLSLATAPAWDDGTPGHRVPSLLRNAEVPATHLISTLATEIMADNPDKFPAWKAPGTDNRTPTAGLPQFLRETAQNQLSWD